MKIAVIGKFGSEEFGWHIQQTFQRMGHEVVACEFGYKRDNLANPVKKRIESGLSVVEQFARQLPRMSRYFDREILRSLDKSVDLVIVTHDFLSPELAARIRFLTNAPLVLWFPDAISQIGRAMFLNAPYDFLFFKDTYTVCQLKDNLKKPIFFMPECCNPETHYPVELTEEDKAKYSCDIVQAGNMNANRVALFSLLARERKYNIKLWGYLPPVWMDTSEIKDFLQYEFVAYEEKAKAFLGGRVLLNNLYPSEINSINARAFEGAGIGAFQFISYRPSLNTLFTEGEEIVSYRNYNELVEKLEYYLPRDEERRRIGTNAHLRAFRDHTYRHRLELILDTVDGRAGGYE